MLTQRFKIPLSHGGSLQYAAVVVSLLFRFVFECHVSLDVVPQVARVRFIGRGSVQKLFRPRAPR